MHAQRVKQLEDGQRYFCTSLRNESWKDFSTAHASQIHKSEYLHISKMSIFGCFPTTAQMSLVISWSQVSKTHTKG